MDVSKNRGTPKWMVENGKPDEMDDLGVPLFLEIPIRIKYIDVSPFPFSEGIFQVILAV